MSISQEFVISLVIQLLILAFFVGIYVATIRFMGKQIEDLKESLHINKKELNDKLDADRTELKEEMRRYNDVLSRIAVAENSILSCHHRLDQLKNNI